MRTQNYDTALHKQNLPQNKVFTFPDNQKSTNCTTPVNSQGQQSVQAVPMEVIETFYGKIIYEKEQQLFEAYK